MALGEKFRSDFFDPDIAISHHNVRGLLQAMMTFAIRNELMLEGLLFVVQPHHTQQRTYQLPYEEARIGSDINRRMRGDRLSY